MSKETTNKKIKIDNGTTFGKTYTDKAVDELLKNVDSIFDITPYLTSNTSMSIEGYNAVREFVTNNKGGIIKATISSTENWYFSCVLTTETYMIFSHSAANDIQASFKTIILNNDGSFLRSEQDIVSVLANPSNDPTDILSKITIGGVVYSIPTGGDYSTEISTLNSRVDSLNNDVAQLLSYNIDSLDSRITQLENDISIINSLDSRINDLENTIIKDIPPLPSDANTKTYTLKSVNGVLTWSA